MRYVFFVGTFLFIFTANAQWASSAREKILQSSSEYNVKGPPGYVSLWG